jgi:putative NADPH-quinone reductase
MKIFLIECNPKEHSSKESYVQAYVEEAKAKGHEVKMINLYDLNIEYLNFSGEKPDITLTFELQQAQDNILWADQIVFVYSIWWLGIPAILKAFIDKTFREGVVVSISKFGPKPLLKGKTAVIMQSYDMPYIGMKSLGDLPMKWWKVVLTKWCGIKIVKRFDFEMISSVSDKRKQKWINDVKNFVAKL